MCYTIDMRHSTQKGHENEDTEMDQYFGSFGIGVVVLFTCTEIGDKNGY